MQKHNRRSAAKQHVRQKLQEHTGLTPQSMQSDLQADVADAKPNGVSSLLDKTAKISKCCVSFKVSSQGSACSCRSVAAEGSKMRAVSAAGSDVCETNKNSVADITDVHNGNLSVNSENLWPESVLDESWELVPGETSKTEHNCSQSDTSSSVLVCNSISDEHVAAIECCDTSWQRDDDVCFKEELTQRPLVATPKNVNRQYASDLQVSVKSDSQERSSLTSESVNASQKLQSSSIVNTSAPAVSSSVCELNFSFMDDDLFAGFTDGDNFPGDLYSPEIDACKNDISETVHHSIEFDCNAAAATENVEHRESSVGADDALSLCRALSAVKIAVAESVKSGVTDFMLPDSQYGEIIRQKVNEKDNAVERIAHTDSTGSSSSQFLQLPQSSGDQLSSHQLQQKQRSVCH